MGAITTDDHNISKLIKKIKAHGRMCECNICKRHLGKCPLLKKKEGEFDFDPRFSHDIIGFNFKTMEFQAAIALTQIEKADEILQRRQFNVQYLNEGLLELRRILRLPHFSKDVSYLAYPIIIEDDKSISGKKLRTELEKYGIETRPLFGCVPTQQYAYHFLKDKYRNKLPTAEYIGANGFYIGCHQYLEIEDLDFIIATFKRILTERG